ERKLDFKPLGIAIKKAREAKGWTQEYLAQLVDLTPRSIMYIENRGQHPRLNKFYLITTLLDISVDQFFFPCNEDGDNNRRKQVDVPYLKVVLKSRADGAGVAIFADSPLPSYSASLESKSFCRYNKSLPCEAFQSCQCPRAVSF